MADKDKVKTAFSTEQGHFHFTRMPFGVKGGPATFQRTMNNVLAGLTGVKCFVYLDDIVVYGYDLNDHNSKLTDVLNCIRKFNLKLQPQKCFFLRKEINFLGHVITNQGIKPDPSKLYALQKFPRPTNSKEIKSFLGLCGYYRRFIKNFAQLTEPLNALLRKNIVFRWDAFCEDAFEKLKYYLMTPPILRYPNFDKSFCITTDASDFAIGAILSQDFDGEDLPIAYASRILNNPERNYPTVEKELLAIVWACKRYRPYVYGTKFTVKTDHKPLIWLNKTANPSSRLVRWRLELIEYNFDVVYKSGKSNCNADSLSRIVIPDEISSSIMPNEINVMTRSRAKADDLQNNSQSLPLPDSPRDSFSSHNNPQTLDTSSRVIPNIIDLSQPHSSTSNIQNTSTCVKVLHDSRDIERVVKEFHCNPVGGHQGISRTFRRIKKYYNFPRMLNYIRKFINKCDLCQRNKVRRLTKCPMSITTTAKATFQKVFLDIVGPLTQSYKGYKYILTVKDDLSKFMVASPLENQEATTVAMSFVKNFICIFGIPLAIQTDQGTNFMSEMFSEICKILKIKKLASTAYHPQSNAVERFHRSLGEYFRNFTQKDPLNWDDWLPYACFAYNTTPHSSTNFMPHELVFGNIPILPTSITSDPEPYYNYDDFSLEMKNKMQNSWCVARENIIKNKELSKIYYDKHVNIPTFKLNDLVLLKRELKTHNKFEPLWEGPFTITEINSKENSTIKKGRKYVKVHNNRLVLYRS